MRSLLYSILLTIPAFSPPTSAAQKSQISPWKRLNNPIIKHTGEKSFTLTAPPATDIWRPNVTANNFTAPYVYRVCKTSDFHRISVTINANWKTRYDQGGIAIVWPGKKPWKWVKTGIEFEKGAPQLGTVATYAFSDWSLSPVVPKKSATSSFLVERNTTEMWAYSVVKGEKYPLREVTWAFLEDRGKKNAVMWVGVYVAKPTYTERKPAQNLTVEFKNLRIEC
ncbi:hypothetical protein AC579_3908 [Pseudocercospora musae]|uniref:Uncharacterized protein n=1 Tax=Pseudocercospora musae TaxID=113226 RepID=A0A139GTI0_9PEZI|nr:hypothetical protein AC579_3908 [Pseudocercospora musae]